MAVQRLFCILLLFFPVKLSGGVSSRLHRRLPSFASSFPPFSWLSCSSHAFVSPPLCSSPRSSSPSFSSSSSPFSLSCFPSVSAPGPLRLSPCVWRLASPAFWASRTRASAPTSPYSSLSLPRASAKGGCGGTPQPASLFESFLRSRTSADASRGAPHCASAAQSRPRAASAIEEESEDEAFARLVAQLRQAGAFVEPGSLLLKETDLLQNSAFVSAERTNEESAETRCKGLREGSLEAQAPIGAARRAESEGSGGKTQLRGLVAGRLFKKGDLIAWIPEALQFSEKNLLAWLSEAGRRQLAGRTTQGGDAVDATGDAAAARGGDRGESAAAAPPPLAEEGRGAAEKSGGGAQGGEERSRANETGAALALGTSAASSKEADADLLLFLNALLQSDTLAGDWQARLAVSLLVFRSWLSPRSEAELQGASTPTPPAETACGRGVPPAGLGALWRAYLSLLPQSLDCMLLFWNLKDLRTLEHRIVNAVLKRIFTLHCVAEAADRLGSPSRSSPREASSSAPASVCRESSSPGRARPGARLDAEEILHEAGLKWAACVVSSRSLRGAGGRRAGALVPLLDLLNAGGGSPGARPNARLTTSCAGQAPVPAPRAAPPAPGAGSEAHSKARASGARGGGDADPTGPREREGDEAEAGEKGATDEESEAREREDIRHEGPEEQERAGRAEGRRETQTRVACTDGIGLVAERDIQVGEEILISYGEDNERLLLNYGFFDDMPRVRKTSLFFSANLVRAALAATEVPDLLLLGGFAGLPARMSAALKKLNLIPNPDDAPHASSAFAPFVAVFADAPFVDGRLLAAARLLMLDDASSISDAFDLERATQWECPFSPENERRACIFLISLLRHDLHRAHSTSLEEDLDMLREGRVPTHATAFGTVPFDPLTKTREVALRFRIHRKRVVREAILALQARLSRQSLQ
ncbi:putative histone lysine methyltransferase, SET [Besnoitia besnoiti]|uniref:Putative histone lysine methyltransferase, SET n=1 Tax=Besnoitia besnoiti TaxID=94643 RepID=A0A2A9MJT4_BESBE|nr:putative histone lysine methyltransferase, SET [Besnoitia besnoiti]PFH36226.1 putative histone lysine methyltransferase, SET [Besnoitia besnoiti]